MTRNYFGLTELEVDLFKTVYELTEKVKELNSYLEKANGYGTDNVKYNHLIRSYELLKERMEFSVTMISEQEFNTDIKSEKRKNGTILLRKEGYSNTAISEEELLMIKDNWGERFIGVIRLDASEGDVDRVKLVYRNINLPIIFFKNITPIFKRPGRFKANTISGFFGFENNSL